MRPFSHKQDDLTVSMPDAATGTGFRDIIRNWMLTAIREWRRRKLTASLQSLDDRQLQDMGVYRDDIRRLVDQFDDRELGIVPVVAGRRDASQAGGNFPNTA
ncbi:MAG: DUF1127 domain-containing protein [Roseovarius sp.]|nr:DUF1127 domain-containing protein [Roseovarius sp.]